MEAAFPIEVRELGVRFGRAQVLAGLSLTVPRGSVTALCGRNGSGKSTLLRVLAGLLVPDAGACSVLGLDPARRGHRVRARIGYVPERLELPNAMRVGEWLGFLESFHPTWDRGLVGELLGLLQLEAGARHGDLSKGNRAKLALVGALAYRPKVLLLDEPFSGLDVSARRSILGAVLAHLREECRTVLVASHSTGDVERLADRVAIIEDGRIVREGELESLAKRQGGGVDLERVLLEVGA